MNTLEMNPASNKSLDDSWDNRIKNAAIFLGITTEQVEQALLSLGVENQNSGMEMISDEEITPFGDIRKIFCDEMNIPIAKVRMAMKFLRGPKESKKTDSINPEIVKMKEKYGVQLKLEYVPTEQLLEDYNPEAKDHPITEILRQRYGTNPVIVFKPDTIEVDIEATSNYISDLDNGFPVEELVESQGEMVSPMIVGEIPDKAIEEDPLFVGSPLKRGRSLINRFNWSEVHSDCRKFVRIAVESSELDPRNKQEVRFLTGLLNDDGNLSALKKEYPKASAMYREKKKLDALPSLTMTIKQMRNSKIQNPFGITKSYRSA